MCMTTADESLISSGHFYFDPEDPIYLDHFPGCPVVPGSLIIHAFLKAFGKDHDQAGGRIEANFRFKHFVAPGRYRYRMTSTSDGRTACRLYDHEKTLVTGIL